VKIIAYENNIQTGWTGGRSSGTCLIGYASSPATLYFICVRGIADHVSYCISYVVVVEIESCFLALFLVFRKYSSHFFVMNNNVGRTLLYICVNLFGPVGIVRMHT
ncbi:unnamed protein product, partial [Ectocarpus fasciculatus]